MKHYLMRGAPWVIFGKRLMGAVLPSLNLGALPVKVCLVDVGDVYGGILSVVCSRTSGSSS
jgi:hypothetical protein